MNKLTRIFTLLSTLALGITMTACDRTPPPKQSAETKDRETVQRQQAQYAKGQPVPTFDWSLERFLTIKLYELRNQNVATHAVWRGDTSVIEGDCPALGFGVPYDTSLTNPLQGEYKSYHPHFDAASIAGVAIGQAEPNGVFQSQNTSATWVMCVDENGNITPVYVESKVTVYPYPVKVDYTTNTVVVEFGVPAGAVIDKSGIR